MRPLRYLWRTPLLLLHVADRVSARAGRVQSAGRCAAASAANARSLDDALVVRRLVRIFGFRIRRIGEPLPGAVLFVANHVSWLDIELMHSQRIMSFVAKAEIARWPLVGWLATRAGTIYHQRGSTHSLGAVMERVVARLRERHGGRRVSRRRHRHRRSRAHVPRAHFPGCGRRQRAGAAGRVVLRQRRADGSCACRSRRGKISSPISCACSAVRRFEASVHFLEPVPLERATAAARPPTARARIAAALGLPKHEFAGAIPTASPGCAIRMCSRCWPRAACAAGCFAVAAPRSSKVPANTSWIAATACVCRVSTRAQSVLAQPRALAILLHGWEGSAQSSYILHTGARLLAEGCDVFRLNFRDHGKTHHLNAGLFHSCRIDEVVGAVGEVAKRFPERPLIIGGFSLGGNFALRVALRAPAAGIPLAGCLPCAR